MKKIIAALLLIGIIVPIWMIPAWAPPSSGGKQVNITGIQCGGTNCTSATTATINPPTDGVAVAALVALCTNPGCLGTTMAITSQSPGNFFALTQGSGQSWNVVATNPGPTGPQVYKLSLHVCATNGRKCLNTTFSVTVSGTTGVNISGISPTTSSFPAGSAQGTLITTITPLSTGGSLTSPTCSITAQTPNNGFQLSGCDLQVLNNALPASTSYSATIQIAAANAGNSPQAYNIALTAVASSPTITGISPITSSVVEASPAGTNVTTITPTSTGGALTGVGLAITSQTCSGGFQISGTSLQVLSPSLAVGTCGVSIRVTASNATNSGQIYNETVSVTATPSNTDAVKLTSVGGVTTTYLLSDGTLLGSWTNPSATFTQQTIKLTRQSAYPCLDIYYRPDTSSSRKEIVFENDDITCSSPADLPGYTAQLVIGGNPVSMMAQGGTLASSTFTPAHYWKARWRMFTAPRAIINTPASLVSSGLVPQTDTQPTQTTSLVAYSPMGTGSVTQNMGGTGDRMDIGVINGWDSEWFSNGNTVARDQSLANAEVSGTIPWHIRDSSGQIANIDNNPNICFDGRFCSSPIPNPVSTNPFSIDIAHWPELNYVTYLETEDPYLLEELQFQATFGISNFGTYNSTGLVWGSGVLQPRAMAWGLRTLGHVAIATPATEPVLALPQEYWLRKLENNRKWIFANTVTSISPVQQAFRFAWSDPPADAYPQGLSSWQSDYTADTTAQFVQAGLSSWAPLLTWFSQGWIDRTAGQTVSGWVRSVNSWYYIGLGPGPIDQYFTAYYTVKTPWATTWANALTSPNAVDQPCCTVSNLQYFTNTARGWGPLPSPDNSLSLYDRDGSIADYVYILMGGMRLGVSQGISALSTNLSWLQTAAIGVAPNFYPKWSFKSTAITHSAQPSSSGDPQFIDPQQTVSAAGTTALGHLKFFATGTGLGNNQTLDATSEFYTNGPVIAVNYTGTYAGTTEFYRSAGYYVLFTKNIRYIKMGSQTFDVVNNTWQ